MLLAKQLASPSDPLPHIPSLNVEAWRGLGSCNWLSSAFGDFAQPSLPRAPVPSQPPEGRPSPGPSPCPFLSSELLQAS